MIIWLNLFAFGGLEAAFLWVIMLGLYWDKANAYGAIASMLTGIGVYIGFTTAAIKPFGLHAIVPSLALGLIALIDIRIKFGEKQIKDNYGLATN